MPTGISGGGREELTRALGRGRRFLTVEVVAEELGLDRSDAAYRLARWNRQGWLRRVRRGLYVPVPVDAENPRAWSEDPLVLAAEVWGPCYFTGWTAANHWSLTDQVFRTTVVKTTGSVRASKARLLDHDYLLTHVSEGDIDWGMARLWIGERRVLMADPARSVIDILDDPRLGGGIRLGAEILAAYLGANDGALLIDYGDRLGNRAVFKRMGYLLTAHDRGESEIIAACRSRVSAGISALDPSGPAGGRYVSAWGLRLNVNVGPEDAS